MGLCHFRFSCNLIELFLWGNSFGVSLLRMLDSCWSSAEFCPKHTADSKSHLQSSFACFCGQLCVLLSPGTPDGRYIRVETCMFMIKLPQYSSFEVMLQRLRYAINCREDPLSGWSHRRQTYHSLQTRFTRSSRQRSLQAFLFLQVCEVFSNTHFMIFSLHFVGDVSIFK